MNAVELATATNELKELFPSLEEAEAEGRELYKQSQELLKEYQEIGLRYDEVERKIALNKKIIETISDRIRVLNDLIETNNLINNITDFKILTNQEVDIITMKIIDEETFVRVANEVVKFKKQYSNWILKNIELSPYSGNGKQFFKFSYITPIGHLMTYDTYYS